MMTSTSNPPTNFSISTARLDITYFDPTSPSHSAFLAHLWNTPDFIATNGKTSITDSHAAQTFIQTRIIPQYTRKGFGLLLVNLRPTSNSPHQNTLPIGTISLMQGDPPNGYSAPDVGFAILPEHQGRGYATEAAKAVIEYVQREWNVQGVFGFCAPGNMRSRRVLEKSGLEFRGVRKLRVFGGKESAVFALVGMEEDLGVYGIDT